MGQFDAFFALIQDSRVEDVSPRHFLSICLWPLQSASRKEVFKGRLRIMLLLFDRPDLDFGARFTDLVISSVHFDVPIVQLFLSHSKAPFDVDLTQALRVAAKKGRSAEVKSLLLDSRVTYSFDVFLLAVKSEKADALKVFLQMKLFLGPSSSALWSAYYA